MNFLRLRFVFLCGLFLNVFTLNSMMTESDRRDFERNGEEFGNKSANLMLLRGLSTEINKDVGPANIEVSVPEFLPISHQRVFDFLNGDRFLEEAWTRFKVAQGDVKGNLTSGAVAILEEIRIKIARDFSEKGQEFRFNELDDFFVRLGSLAIPLGSENILLMVRSTGKEDTKECPNAGGNESVAAVKLERQDVLEAMSVVVQSYFSEKSLTQRLIANDDILVDPFVPVLIQVMIGEKVGGTIEIKDIPISGVMFTQEAEGYTFGVTQIQATFGHNEAVVNSLVPVDTFYIGNIPFYLNGEAFFTTHSIIRKKNRRLVSVEDDDKYKLDFINNNEGMQLEPCLGLRVVEALKVASNLIEKYYDAPTDIEFVVRYVDDTTHIYLVQARPIVSPRQIEARYLNSEFIKSLDEKYKIEFNVIGSGGGALVFIDNKDQVIVTDTLPQALNIFNGRNIDRQNKKIVLVAQQAPSTSHEATIFRSEGIPVLVFNDLEKISKLISMDNLIAFDVQRCLAVNCVDKSLDGAVVAGWFRHPIPQVVSLAATEIDIEKLERLAGSPFSGSIRRTGSFRVSSRGLARTREEDVAKILRKESGRQEFAIDRFESVLVRLTGDKEFERIQKMYKEYFDKLVSSLRLNIIPEMWIERNYETFKQIQESRLVQQRYDRDFILYLFEMIKSGFDEPGGDLSGARNALRAIVKIILDELRFAQGEQEGDLFDISLYLLDKRELTKFIYYLLTCANEVLAILNAELKTDSGELTPLQKRMLLFYSINFLEALVFQKPNKNILDCYSFEYIKNKLDEYSTGVASLRKDRDPEDRDPEYRATGRTERLDGKEIMKRLFGEGVDKYILRKLINLVLQRKYAINDQISAKWLKFIIILSRLKEPPETFFGEIQILLDYDVFPIWLNSIFNNTWDGEVESVTDVISRFEEEFARSSSTIEYLVQSQSILNVWEGKVSDWGNPDDKSFKKLWENFNEDFIKVFVRGERIDKAVCPLLDLFSRDDGTNIERILILELFSRVVDVYDKSIKGLTGSPDYKDLDLKAERFKLLLEPYLFLMSEWLRKIDRTGWSSLAHSSDQGLYIRSIKKIYNDLPINKRQFIASSDFNVNAAMIGSKADFERHKPSTLEDVFMLVHQNMLMTITYFNNQFGLSKEILPYFAKQVFEELLKIKKINFLGVGYNYPDVVVHFNIPLMQHSTKIDMFLNIKDDESVALKFYYIGHNNANRMNFMLLYSILAAFASGYELDPKPNRFYVTTRRREDELGIEFTWKISENSNLESLHKHVEVLGEMSFWKFTIYYALALLELVNFIEPFEIDSFIEGNWERIIDHSVCFSDYLIEHFLKKNRSSPIIDFETEKRIKIIINKTRENINRYSLQNKIWRFFPNFLEFNVPWETQSFPSFESTDLEGRPEDLDDYLLRVERFLEQTDLSIDDRDNRFLDLILLVKKSDENTVKLLQKNKKVFKYFIARHFPALLNDELKGELLNSGFSLFELLNLDKSRELEIDNVLSLSMRDSIIIKMLCLKNEDFFIDNLKELLLREDLKNIYRKVFPVIRRFFASEQQLGKFCDFIEDRFVMVLNEGQPKLIEKFTRLLKEFLSRNINFKIKESTQSLICAIKNPILKLELFSELIVFFPDLERDRIEIKKHAINVLKRFRKDIKRFRKDNYDLVFFNMLEALLKLDSSNLMFFFDATFNNTLYETFEKLVKDRNKKRNKKKKTERIRKELSFLNWAISKFKYIFIDLNKFNLMENELYEKVQRLY